MEPLKHDKPLVSIGMPLYNGERYIRKALDSLMAQDYENFELIISDNAATDRTQEICLEYAAGDKRIQYYRNEMNMGAVWNFERVLQLSTGDFFMWAADDDAWEKDYVSTLLSVMNQFPKSIVSFTNYMKYSGTGDLLGNEDLISSEVCELGFRELIGMVFSSQKINVALYGLFRRNDLQTLLKDGFPNCDAPDRVIFAHFALSGKTVTLINKYLYKRTIHDKSHALRHGYTIRHNKFSVFIRDGMSRLRYYIQYIKLLVKYSRSNSINNILYFYRKFTGYVIMIEILYLRSLSIAILRKLPCSRVIKSRIKRV
jgi:glycosyltransferase involved in cell wall biosynthesis